MTEPSKRASPQVQDDRARLLVLTDLIGAVFGTEHFCLFLYALVRMSVPKLIVELGTGLGISAFWLGLASKENGVGHVWTLDDLNLFTNYGDLLDTLLVHLEEVGFGTLRGSTPSEYFQGVSAIL